MFNKKTLNKTAPVIHIDDPMFSVNFYPDIVMSEYDILLTPDICNCENRIVPDDIRLGELLYKKIYLNQDYGFNVEACLNYHYDKCKVNKDRFINFTKRALTEKPYNKLQSQLITEDIVKTILNWCNAKKNDNIASALNEDLDIARKENEQPLIKKNANYLITAGKIIDLHALLTAEKLIKEIEISDFLKCFDLNNNPTVYPVYNNQTRFAYVLSVIKNETNEDLINDALALSHFNIKNYKSIKCQIKTLRPPDFTYKQKVLKVLKQDRVTIDIKNKCNN